jgi:hypothetical protein
MNPGQLKGSDPVLRHPKWGTVHEARYGETVCGNPGGVIRYSSMTRGQADGMAGSKPCRSLACEAARR